MKTSNKLLIGLIITILFLVAITVAMTRSIHLEESYEVSQSNKEEASAEITLTHRKTVNVALLSPITFLQLPRQLR